MLTAQVIRSKRDGKPLARMHVADAGALARVLDAVRASLCICPVSSAVLGIHQRILPATGQTLGERES